MKSGFVNIGSGLLYHNGMVQWRYLNSRCSKMPGWVGGEGKVIERG